MKPTNMVNYVLDLKRELEGSNEGEEVPEGSFPRIIFLCDFVFARHGPWERVSSTHTTPIP
jgi:hypothetical protein